MSLTSLKNNLMFGIESLDYEHQRLVGVMETICDNIESKQPSYMISDWFGELYAEVSAHFALEEALMSKKGYVSVEAHKADHERLLELIRSKMESFEKGMCVDCGMSLRTCLEMWYSKHAKEMDVELRNLAN